MTHLYLIRHGESMNPVQKRFGDLDLSPLGVRQAERLRDRLAATGEMKADVLISSTLRRAYQTAEIIAPALGLPIVPDDEVQEIHEGEAASLSEEEFLERFGMPDFMQNPFRPWAPGAESWPEFMLRIGRALHRITQDYADKHIVVVCHGGVIEGAFVYFAGLTTLSVPPIRFLVENTSITHWSYGPLFLDQQKAWNLVSYNDHFHLRDLDLPEPLPWEKLSRPRHG